MKPLFEVKALFLNRPKVIAAMETATKAALGRFGAFVRKSARSSIRRRKGVSRPGQPPTSRTGLLKKFLFYTFDAQSQSVVIGPAQLKGSAFGTAPEALEYGGTTTTQRRGGAGTVEIAARPFMGPAFEKGTAKLDEFWAKSLR